MLERVLHLPEADTVDPAESLPGTEEILTELRQDVRLAAFFLGPRISPTQSGLLRFGESLGLSMDELIVARAKFLRIGAWHIDLSDRIVIDPKTQDLYDLALADFTGLTLQIISACSETGPCWYDSMTVATSQALKRTFYRKVNQALRELIDESAKTECDTVLAWSHVGVAFQEEGT